MWESLGQRGRSNIKRADLSFGAFVRHFLTHTDHSVTPWPWPWAGREAADRLKVREQTVNCDGGVSKAPEEGV